VEKTIAMADTKPEEEEPIDEDVEDGDAAAEGGEGGAAAAKKKKKKKKKVNEDEAEQMKTEEEKEEEEKKKKKKSAENTAKAKQQSAYRIPLIRSFFERHEERFRPQGAKLSAVISGYSYFFSDVQKRMVTNTVVFLWKPFKILQKRGLHSFLKYHETHNNKDLLEAMKQVLQQLADLKKRKQQEKEKAILYKYDILK
jgi:hypothetical protein